MKIKKRRATNAIDMLESILVVILINLVGFALGYLLQSDKFTDVLYASSFAAVVMTGWYLSSDVGGAKLIVGLLVLIWAIRLGGYLFIRIHKMQSDQRFEQMRPVFWRFLGFWILQIVSIIIIALPVIFLLAKPAAGFSWTVAVGAGIWLIGFVLEAVADWQKFRFKLQAENKDTFIQSGLWRSIRHPNYLGEILVWLGIFVACLPWLEGIEWMAVASPIWIFVLLRYISGIPLLEERANEKYGKLAKYQEYVQKTGRLLPGM